MYVASMLTAYAVFSNTWVDVPGSSGKVRNAGGKGFELFFVWVGLV